MDTAYWAKLNTDESSPLYNKATQQKTAPGSTFKPLMAVAGLSEGVITPTETINCNGLFGEGLVNESDYVHCNLLTGHGDLNIVGAIQNSCNVFLYHWLPSGTRRRGKLHTEAFAGNDPEIC